jgi:DNA-3-methyladenine glycosylase
LGAYLHVILKQQFFAKSTLTLAQELLGKFLVRKTEEGEIAGMITDVEAYVGPKDKASHASRGRTKRTNVMFGPPGYWYIYLIYGMYHCLNIVTEPEAYPAAILIRSILRDSDHMCDFGTVNTPRRSARSVNSSSQGNNNLNPVAIKGPGRVCRYFNIDKTFNEKPAAKKTGLWIEDRGLAIDPQLIQAGPRIGINYAGEWKDKPWRYYVAKI